MSRLSLAFQLSASATGMSQGINAGVVELQKLGLEAKRTARDVSTLKTLEISRAFINGVSAVANTFRSFTAGAASSIDATVKLSRSLGVSFQELRNLQIAADLSGASSESLARAFTRAQVTITRASTGSREARTALAALGLTVEDLVSQTSVQQFSSIAAAITAIQNPAQRAAAAVAIFGRSGAELLPTFRELPDNLNRAQTFFGGFARTLNDVDAASIEEINDSFGLASESIRELAGRLLVELAPALTRGAQQFVTFVQRIDVPAAARNVERFLSDLVAAFNLVARAAVPLASNLLPAIGGYLAFINRQIIGAGIASLGRVFLSAATAASAYSSGALTAAAATTVLASSVRAFLISTGVGALPVILGVAAGYFLDLSVSANTAGQEIAASTDAAANGVKRLGQEAQNARLGFESLGEEVKNALRVPDLSVQDFAQDSLSEARSAIVSFAKELGGLDKIPTDVRSRFEEIAQFARTITSETLNETQALRLVDQNARALTATVQGLADANKRQTDAAKEAADAARRGAEEARQRTATLATEGLPAAEQARLQLNKDLLAIQREQRAAEQALADARANQDSRAVADAKARLSLIEQARDAAFEQNRERQRQALGVDENIIRPAQSIADQFRNLRDAFTREAINPEQFQLGIRNLAEEGIRIRREIVADLSRPANRALQAADIRTQEGAAQFAALASGREDPAISQRREQLAKLDEIRRALVSINIRPVEILGG